MDPTLYKKMAMGQLTDKEIDELIENAIKRREREERVMFWIRVGFWATFLVLWLAYGLR